MKLIRIISLIISFCILLTLSLPTNALCCYPKPLICVQALKPQYYIDLGLEQAFNTHLSSSQFEVITPSNPNFDFLFSMSPSNNPFINHIALETGILWPHPYQADSPYFPFINLGLRYQYSNVDQKKTSVIASEDLQESASMRSLDIANSQRDFTFSHHSLLVNLKMDVYRWNRIMPFVNLGLGASWNRSKLQNPFLLDLNGQEINLNYLSFNTTRNTAFSYQVGAGLDFLATDNFWLSLGYLYNNFGQIQLGTAKVEELIRRVSSYSASTVKFRDLTAHTIQLTGRYVFG